VIESNKFYHKVYGIYEMIPKALVCMIETNFPKWKRRFFDVAVSAWLHDVFLTLASSISRVFKVCYKG